MFRSPRPGVGEVLIRCRAAGINNTDINTRIAWYSKSVTGATNACDTTDREGTDDSDGGWSGEPINFPRIQGADCYGEFAQFAVAPDADVYHVDSDLTDAELGAIPCAYSTAEGMLVRSAVGRDDRILVTGASGGPWDAKVFPWSSIWWRAMIGSHS
jgi:NADPH:quinone reductase-like Zn-dependent oxidoreductase